MSLLYSEFLVRNFAKILSVITHLSSEDQVAVYDPMDPTSTPEEVRKKSLIHTTERISSQETCTSILNGLKVGVPQVKLLLQIFSLPCILFLLKEYFPSEMSPDIIEPIRKLIARLKSYGAIVIPVSLPTTSYALSSYYVLATAEASSNLARYDGVQYGKSLLYVFDHTTDSDKA